MTSSAREGARSANSFLTWAHEEGLLPERLRIRLLPDPPKPLTPISGAEIYIKEASNSVGNVGVVGKAAA